MCRRMGRTGRASLGSREEPQEKRGDQSEMMGLVLLQWVLPHPERLFEGDSEWALRLGLVSAFRASPIWGTKPKPVSIVFSSPVNKTFFGPNLLVRCHSTGIPGHWSFSSATHKGKLSISHISLACQWTSPPLTSNTLEFPKKSSSSSSM